MAHRRLVTAPAEPEPAPRPARPAAPPTARYPHRYGGTPSAGCMYCGAAGTEAGKACAVAERVELHYTSRHPGCIYDPVQHLRGLVSALEARRGGGWRLERVEGERRGGPLTRFRVLRGGEVIAEAASVVVELAAREVVARVWGWAEANPAR